MSVEYLDAYEGDCSRGCTRRATVRIHKEWIVCTLHYLDYRASKKEDEASLALGLMKPWRSEAEFHGCLNLAAELDRIAERETRRVAEAKREYELLERVEAESEPSQRWRSEGLRGGADA